MVRVGDPRQFSRIPLTAVMTRVMDLRDSDVIHHDGKSPKSVFDFPDPYSITR